jgi:hypothetical protein
MALVGSRGRSAASWRTMSGRPASVRGASLRTARDRCEWRRDMIRKLVGSGDKIGLLVLPFLVGGVILNLVNPRPFEVGGPPWLLRVISIAGADSRHRDLGVVGDPHPDPRAA